jgi:hypothetical protein
VVEFVFADAGDPESSIRQSVLDLVMEAQVAGQGIMNEPLERRSVRAVVQ